MLCIKEKTQVKGVYGVYDTLDNTLEYVSASAIKQLLLAGGSVYGAKISQGGRLLCRCIPDDECAILAYKSKLALLGFSRVDEVIKQSRTGADYICNLTDLFGSIGVGMDNKLKIPRGTNICKASPSAGLIRRGSEPQVCYNFDELVIPESCRVITSSSFSGWGIWSKNKFNYTISGLGNLYEVPQNCFSYANNLVGDVVFGHNLSLIGDKAFAYTSISRVFIPNSCTAIGDGAFEKCNNLQEVVVERGTNFNTIGRVFYYCPNAVFKLPREFYAKYKEAFPGIARFELY